MKNYVMCAGVAYEFRGEPFRSFARNRYQNKLTELPRGEDATFLLLDFQAGTTTTVSVTWKGGEKKILESTKKTHHAITKANYKSAVVDGETLYSFKRNLGLKIMSILDVYAAIRSIGEKHAGTLEEVSIFSHAYIDGPILVNSDDLFDGRDRSLPDDRNLRDSDDYDARSSKDFAPSNMPPAKLKMFSRAFSRDGYCWIWGCTSADATRQIIAALVAAKPDARKEDSVDLRLTRDQVKAFAVFANYFDVNFDIVKRTGRCKVAVADIFSAISGQVEGCYAMRMARLCGVGVRAALVGTYAEFEDARSGGLMRISPHRDLQVQFYKKYFGFSLDPERRRYGIYLPQMELPG